MKYMNIWDTFLNCKKKCIYAMAKKLIFKEINFIVTLFVYIINDPIINIPVYCSINIIIVIINKYHPYL